MPATLLQLKDQIIIDSGIEGNPKFPSLRLTRLINLAQRKVQTQLNGLGMRKWENSDSLTLSPGTFNIVGIKTSSLSTDFPNMIESPNSIIFIECTGVSNSGLAYEVDKDRFAEQLANTYLAPTEKQPIFMRLAQKVYIAPSTITSATAYYYKNITDLSADSDITEMPAEFEEYIVKNVIIDIEYILGKLADKSGAQNQLANEVSQAYEKFLGKQAELTRTRINEKSKVQ